MAVAAKISAARALARKLSKEKQATVAAARAAAENSLDEEEIDRCTSIDVISYMLGECPVISSSLKGMDSCCRLPGVEAHLNQSIHDYLSSFAGSSWFKGH